MMATTHALVGLLVAGVAAAAVPEAAGPAVTAGFVGGIFPDLDLYAGHRRTLHYPVLFPVVAAVGTVVAALVGTVAAVAGAVFLVAAALHCAMDVYGGGLELRPWRGTSDRAVYDHVRRRWLPPRGVIRYDGAPEDLALAVILAVPTVWLHGPGIDHLVAAVLAVSVAYTLVRRRLVEFARRLYDRLPPALAARLPEQIVDDLR